VLVVFAKKVVRSAAEEDKKIKSKNNFLMKN